MFRVGYLLLLVLAGAFCVPIYSQSPCCGNQQVINHGCQSGCCGGGCGQGLVQHGHVQQSPCNPYCQGYGGCCGGQIAQHYNPVGYGGQYGYTQQGQQPIYYK